METGDGLVRLAWSISRWLRGEREPKPTKKRPSKTKSSRLERKRFVLRGDGSYDLDVVGESRYQDNLERICGPRRPEGEDKLVDAELVPEPTNPKDSFAIRVEIQGLPVGYLSRKNARIYHRKILKKRGPTAVAQVKANIRGGWERPNGERGHYGVWLDFEL